MSRTPAIDASNPSYPRMVERESWAAPQDSAIIGNEDRAREVLGSYDQDGVTEVALQILGPRDDSRPDTSVHRRDVRTIA